MAIRRLIPNQPERIQPDISLFVVNIVLLLILFFLASGQTMNGSAIEYHLAITTDLPLDLLPQPLLQIGPVGNLTLNGTLVSDDDLLTHLAGSTELYVLIGADTEATRLVEILAHPDLKNMNIELVTVADHGGQP